ncbi:MAG: hypothetical protein ACREBR_01235, partial [bacterium]
MSAGVRKGERGQQRELSEFGFTNNRRIRSEPPRNAGHTSGKESRYAGSREDACASQHRMQNINNNNNSNGNGFFKKQNQKYRNRVTPVDMIRWTSDVTLDENMAEIRTRNERRLTRGHQWENKGEGSFRIFFQNINGVNTNLNSQTVVGLSRL